VKLSPVETVPPVEPEGAVTSKLSTITALFTVTPFEVKVPVVTEWPEYWSVPETEPENVAVPAVEAV
jgi:hypothetical protein